MVDYVLRLRMGNPAPPDPEIPATQTISFGAKTLKGHGGHPLAYTGTGTLSITSQRTDLGATVTLFSIDSHNKLVFSGTFGTASPALTRSQYVCEVTDGSTSSTVTVNIAANTWHITSILSGTNADDDQPGAGTGVNQLKTVMVSSLLALGDTIIGRDGTVINNTDQDVRVRRPANAAVAAAMTGEICARGSDDSVTCNIPDASWIKITSETPYGMTIKRLMLDGATQTKQGFWFHNIDFENLYSGTAMSGGILILGTGTTSGSTRVSYVRISNCRFASNLTTDTQLLGTQLLNGVQGNAGCQEIYVHDNLFDGLYTGTNITGTQGISALASTPSNVWVVGNTFRNQWSDARKFATCAPAYSLWNLTYDKRYGADPTPGSPSSGDEVHGDYEQRLFNGAIAGTYAFGCYIGNIDVRGNGTDGFADGQGLYQTLGGTSVVLTGTVVRGNAYIGNFARAIHVTACESPIIEHNTAVKDLTVGVSSNTPGIHLRGCTGTPVIRYNAVAAAVSATEEDIVTETTTGTITDATNVHGLDTQGEYDLAFTAPAFGDSLRSIEDIVAGWSMKSAGPLDLAVNVGAIGTGYVDYVNRTTSFPA